jgi:hypothetical protein
MHPDPEIAAAAVRFLQPHWGGSAEEVVAFAAETADLTREKYGDTVYALIAYELKSQHDPYPFDWPRVQKGFEDAIRLAPQWLPTYHRYAKLAWYGKDRAKARELFQRDELAWYRDAHLIWVDRVVYETVRKWALEEDRPPAAAPVAPVAQRPTPTLSTLNKFFSTPVFVKIGRKQVEGKIMGYDRGSGGKVTTLHIGLREKLAGGVKLAGLQVVNGDGKVVAVVRGRSQTPYEGMQEVLDTDPTAAIGEIP